MLDTNECKICNISFRNLKGLVIHLVNKHKNISKEEYFRSFFPFNDKCKICGNKTEFISIRKGYKIFCSSVCKGKGHSLKMKDDGNPRYGTKMKNETKEKISISQKKRKIDISGEKNGMYGKKHSKETRKKMSLKRSGKNNPIYGRTGSLAPMYGKKHSNKTKKKMRLSRIKDINEKHGVVFPNYNKEACEWFKLFDKVNGTKGRYALYGGGEYLIEELGYWPDYINFDMKLIVEWDEKRHEKQIERDIVRQKEIMEHFPNFEFMRIKRK